MESKFALENYIGKTFSSKNYDDFTVLGVYDKYIDKSNRKLRYVIEFLNTGFQTISFPNRIRSGDIKDYMKPVHCGVGYVGDMDYTQEPSKHILYKHWSGMFDRCYNKDGKYYRELGEVHENWHCFKDFIEDVENILGYKEMIENTKIKWSVDKDYIKEGNQLYSKETCIFIPQIINSFIQNRLKDREYQYEGFYISQENKTNRFASDATYKHKTISIGYYDNPTDAHRDFWIKKLEIAHKYIEQDYPFILEELRQVIYNRVKLREQISLKELNRAINDGYFKNIM